MAEHFLDLGDNVIGCARSQATLQHPNYQHYTADLAEASEVADMMSAIRSGERSLDVLVNNAAVAMMGASASTSGCCSQDD